MKIHKLTIIFVVLVFGTLGLTFAKRNQVQSNKASDSEALKKLQEKKAKFPVAKYDEPELADPKKNQTLKEKKLRHNNFKMVTSDPPDWQAQLLFIDESLSHVPTLPVTQSAYIVLGEVKSAEAHLSENKKNVYSEFTVVVKQVLKTAKSSIIEGTEITVDRLGGLVTYPNGRTVLYRLSGRNMPAVGERYLFFLTAPNNHDLMILTAYRLDPSGVVPLDDSPQFEKFRGTSQDVFLQNLRELLSKPSGF